VAQALFAEMPQKNGLITMELLGAPKEVYLAKCEPIGRLDSAPGQETTIVIMNIDVCSTLMFYEFFL